MSFRIDVWRERKINDEAARAIPYLENTAASERKTERERERERERECKAIAQRIAHYYASATNRWRKETRAADARDVREIAPFCQAVFRPRIFRDVGPIGAALPMRRHGHHSPI
jgi:hypothetical protein